MIRNFGLWCIICDADDEPDPITMLKVAIEQAKGR